MEVLEPPAGTSTLLGLGVVESPDGEGEANRMIVLEKPLMLPNVTVAVPEVPAAIVIELGLVLILKSTTSIVIVTEWDRDPLVPVTVTVYVCTEVELTVRVDLPDEPAVTTTVPGLGAATSPVGDADDIRRMVPEKSSMLLRVRSVET